MSKARCVVWIDPAQVSLLKGIIERGNFELIGAGSPDSARIGQVASSLDTQPIDDLRHAFASADADLFILGDPGSFGNQASDPDLEGLKAAHGRNVEIATFEPIPATASEIAGTLYAESLQNGSLNELVRLAPLTRHTPTIVELLTVLETFGPIRSCNIAIGVPSNMGSLGARLFDAMDLIRSLVGVPNMIEAAYISPAAGRGLHPLPGQSLRDLHGEITTNLRFSDGRCASMLLSDQIGSSNLSMTLIGAEGLIQVDNHGFKWQDSKGNEIDSYQYESTPEIDQTEIHIAEQLIELCSGVGPKRSPIDYQTILSMTHSTLLSTRTGQGESPRSVEQIMLSM
ncbi:MAG: hypothetical protein P1U42_09125 [Phycisphaerales bacterium]|nr:hypothetical protein [Phycisphaerales bacterium]